MSVAEFAALYVHYIEPTLRVLFFLAIIVAVLYFFNMLKDSKKKSELIGTIFNFMVKAVVGGVVGFGKGLLWFVKTMLKIITILFATVRDFFVSKI
jgi:lysylphosphatidylglycerol synthetase-like protein (DUF2156 family)